MAEEAVFSTSNNQLPNLQVIQDAISKGFPVSIITYTFPYEMECYINKVLSTFFHELKQDYMTEYFSYCLKEMVINSKRANTKRIYFREKKLDIFDAEDYEKGMNSFKKEIIANSDYYIALQKKAGLYVKLILQVKKNIIRFEIRNNVKLTFQEYKRIHDKFSRTLHFPSMEETITSLDKAEGGGLGLIITGIMLQKLGISMDNVEILNEKDETIFRIMIPVFKNEEHHLATLSKEIAATLETVPQFPENITKINQMLNNPNVKISDIVMHISNDVTLTADLLRMANKASFRLALPCTNVAAAVKMIGLRGIKNLLYTIGTIQNLDSTNKAQKKLWDHASKTASYSQILSYKLCNGETNIISDAYVCGLLHDIGKILFDAAHPDIIKKYKDICVEKNIPQRMLEKLTAGANHAEIGAMVTANWNFPDVITNAIRYHHMPLLAPEEHRKSVQLVHIADMLVHYQENEVTFQQFDSETLEAFQLNSEDMIEELSMELNILYSS